MTYEALYAGQKDEVAQTETDIEVEMYGHRGRVDIMKNKS